MRILIDSREQAPYTFSRYEATTEVVALAVGDYSLSGFQDKIAIERKELNDLLSCLKGEHRVRFERELARGQHYDLFCVVVEATLADVSNGRYKSEMKAHAALQSVFSFTVRYGTAFIWCGNRAGAEYVTYSLLSKYLREIGERYKLATKHQEAAA